MTPEINVRERVEGTALTAWMYWSFFLRKGTALRSSVMMATPHPEFKKV